MLLITGLSGPDSIFTDRRHIAGILLSAALNNNQPTICPIIYLYDLQCVKTGGKLDIRFISYWSDGMTISRECCELLCSDKCDPKFSLCIYGSDGGNPCSLYQSTTDYIDNHNKINFGSSIQGKANPFIIPVPKAVPSSITIRVEVYDNDDTSIDDHLDTFSKLINIKATATEQTAVYIPYILRGRTQ
ncbi:uncharacterized protein LOC124282068 [Haliotis rubra]|uniref:uncharacterized protein LOC124282068 n=1 Tax=Haliotis rubra TaxID=36100 RepID=UPI001EE61889|nr:uncharacterized protein LOC124282068 [Haliotis rubra]